MLRADWYSLILFTETSASASITDHFISIVPISNADPGSRDDGVLQSNGGESVVTVSPSDAASVVSGDQPSEMLDSKKQSGDQLSEMADSRKKSHGQPSETGKSIFPISKYLVVPTSSTPTGPKTLSHARLFTNAECLAQLERKERQKHLAAEEKEQRKNGRRAMREQEQKQKVAERAKKAEESARKPKDLAEKKAKKAAGKTTRKIAEKKSRKAPEKTIRKTAGKTSRKTAEKTTRKTVEKANSTPGIGGEAAPSTESNDEPVLKKRRRTNSI